MFFKASCAFTYAATQADMDAGQGVNLATASATDVTPATDTETVTGPVRAPAFTFEKQAPATFTAVGETVNFTFAVSNTGNVTLSNVLVSDPFFGTPVSCTIPTIAPGATDTTCTASYVVQQADVDAGQITNTATVTPEVPAPFNINSYHF